MLSLWKDRALQKLMYRSRDASSDDMIGEVCVRNSRSCLRNKVSCIFSGETLTIRYDVICTVVLVADVNRQLICLLSPACHHRSPRCIYVGYGRYLFVDIVPRASADLGITSQTWPEWAWVQIPVEELDFFLSSSSLFYAFYV